VTLPPPSKKPVLRLVCHHLRDRTYPPQLPKAVSIRPTVLGVLVCQGAVRGSPRPYAERILSLKLDTTLDPRRNPAIVHDTGASHGVFVQQGPCLPPIWLLHLPQ
jgi:hypothetical protein